MFRLLQVNHHKPFRITLLANFVAVSPLESHSYEKTGVSPPALTVFCPQSRNYMRFLSLKKKGEGVEISIFRTIGFPLPTFNYPPVALFGGMQHHGALLN